MSTNFDIPSAFETTSENKPEETVPNIDTSSESTSSPTYIISTPTDTIHSAETISHPVNVTSTPVEIPSSSVGGVGQNQELANVTQNQPQIMDKNSGKEQVIIDEENSIKDSALNKILVKYDTDNYLRNPAFKEFYLAAYDALGANLDTDLFVSLLDKYVNSRIEANNISKALDVENSLMTDKMEFQSGVSKRKEEKIRMQDIPPEELEKYIAKYI